MEDEKAKAIGRILFESRQKVTRHCKDIEDNLRKWVDESMSGEKFVYYLFKHLMLLQQYFREMPDIDDE